MYHIPTFDENLKAMHQYLYNLTTMEDNVLFHTHSIEFFLDTMHIHTKKWLGDLHHPFMNTKAKILEIHTPLFVQDCPCIHWYIHWCIHWCIYWCIQWYIHWCMLWCLHLRKNVRVEVFMNWLTSESGSQSLPRLVPAHCC